MMWNTVYVLVYGELCYADDVLYSSFGGRHHSWQDLNSYEAW